MSEKQSEKQPLKIISMIAQLEEEIEASPKARFGAGKVMVEKSVLMDIIGDIKVTVPEDIRRAQALLTEEMSILTLAKQEAEELVAHATQEAEQIRSNAELEFEARVNESAVLMEAMEQAQTVLARANATAEQVTSGSYQYADNILIDLQRYLEEYHAIIGRNRTELQPGIVNRAALDQDSPYSHETGDVELMSAEPVQELELDLDLDINTD